MVPWCEPPEGLLLQTTMANRRQAPAEGGAGVDAAAASPLPNISLVDRFRECDFQLVTGDVAYLDWVKVKGGGLKLVRASFDGYGCCRCGDHVSTMNATEAAALLAILKAKEIDQAACRAIVVKYCVQNKGALWEDALEEHGLLRFA